MTSEWTVVWDRKNKRYVPQMSSQAIATAFVTAFRDLTPESYIVALAPNQAQAESFAETLNHQAR